MNKRAYSVIDIKAVDEDKRIIEGIATTPAPDRMGDIIETEGIEFKLPLPLLYQHDSKNPIGNVVKAKVSKAGIEVKAQIAPPGIDEAIDKAWNKIKAGLVRGLSIGFRSIEEAFNKETGGFRILKSEWVELSAVTIPANSGATILSIKSADAATLAALGERRGDVVRLDTKHPGVSGQTKRGNPVKKTIKEQISEFENKRAANEARMEELMTKAADEGRTLDEAETEEYDGLGAEVKQVDEHLVRLRAHEKQIIARAQQVTATTTINQTDGGAPRQTMSHGPITVKRVAPQGIGVARMVIAMIRANNNAQVAADLAQKYWPDMPEVSLSLKATIEAGDTTTSGWASQLVPSAQQMQDEFLELFRPQTIIGRIPGLRRVPFNIAVPIETASGTAQWVGEGAPKPVTKLTLSSTTLTWAKAAAIVAITKELAKFSRPDAEMVVRESMVKTLVRFFDTHFVSTTAAVANVSPAGILNGISATSTSGTTVAAFRTDMNTMLKKMTGHNVDPGNIVLLMSATQALALSLAVTDLGVRLFADISVGGGSILGIPVIVSEAVGTKIIAINASDILLASDPGVQVDVSDTASVEMSDTPILGDTSPTTGAVLKSFWQNNLIGVRVEQFITWKVARTDSVEYLTSVAYVP